ncbi:Phage-related holin (Lysis protein) [Paenibacillus algorifonticola]|uniref:Phage-related holin (Lysis protein) n=1 Tax=Paenibacillus algorifonticola TaxID=684063 RepID=A0A1I2AHI6_9BACL|nr:phage holin family protein [Paenibacillus algorifonticola]SFE43177.1 Phage-related holin (Lysis protein) [Paenibacillus algorifonticola]
MTGKTIFGAIGAVAVPVFEYMYGAGEAVITAMVALTFFILMDWLSGVRAAKKDFSYSSKYGIDGIFRTMFMLLLPAGGHLIDKMFNLPGILFGALTAGLLYHVIQSMVANSLRAGWGEWLPINVLETLLKWVGSELDKKINRAAERGGVVGGGVDADTDAGKK